MSQDAVQPAHSQGALAPAPVRFFIPLARFSIGRLASMACWALVGVALLGVMGYVVWIAIHLEQWRLLYVLLALPFWYLVFFIPFAAFWCWIRDGGEESFLRFDLPGGIAVGGRDGWANLIEGATLEEHTDRTVIRGRYETVTVWHAHCSPDDLARLRAWWAEHQSLAAPPTSGTLPA